MSDKSRSDVKADAKAAVKTGATAEGEKGGSSYSGPSAKTGSTASRPEVKADAKAAVKAGTTAEGELNNKTPGRTEAKPASAR